MNLDHLRSNGYSNGHSAQVERKSKRVDYPRLLALGRELLLAIGEDPEREGLRETPRRWAETYFTIEQKSDIIYLSSYKMPLGARLEVGMPGKKCELGCTCRRHARGSSDDITGKRFAKLVVLSFYGRDKKNTQLWTCQCDCGKQTVVRRHELVSGKTQSCGCWQIWRKRLPIDRKCSNPDCDERDPSKFYYSKRNGERYPMCILCTNAKNKRNRQILMQDEERAQRFLERNRERAAEYRRLHPEAYWEGADRRENNRYKKQYGVSLYAVRRMTEELQNRCMICGAATKLTIDHCHTKGAFRGLLCGDCNRALGLFHDNPDTLRRAADYLEMDRSGWKDGW